MKSAEGFVTIEIMHSTETHPTQIRRLTIALPEDEHAEFVRLSNAPRNNRTPGKQGVQIVRDWIASEQAAEAEEASAAA